MDTRKHDYGGRLRDKEDKRLDYASLLELHNERQAICYLRLSTYEQTRKHKEGLQRQKNLADQARADGYPDSLITVIDDDLGISGTKGREDRPGLERLIRLMEAGKVEAVYVTEISRLFRDQTMINTATFAALAKDQGVIIVTPFRRLNLRDRMHHKEFFRAAEWAADELDYKRERLLGARDLKARSGRYAGESLPVGYVVDTRKKLSNGEPNPNYEGYLEHKPHLDVVRQILHRLLIPGATYTQVARYCDQHSIVFPPFPPELDTKANGKTFCRSEPNADGSFSVTVFRVRSIAHNPAYIGWKVWGGEIVGKNVYPPAIEEHLFEAIQERFGKSNRSRPKMSRDPLPLAGLLYCGNHDLPQKMSYHNREPASQSIYECFDPALFESCTLITCTILDDPISEAITSQLGEVSELAEEVLDNLTDEYQQAKEEAASYRREMRRLEAEIENLRGNLASGILGTDSMTWVEQQVEERLERIRELADLGSRPVGQAVGRPIPGKHDIELVRATLENLEERWPRYPNGLKNAILRLLLDQVVVWSEPLTVRVRLVWRIGLEQELLIRRRHSGIHRSWDDTELETLEEHYETATKNDLMQMLPDRTWRAIQRKGQDLGLSRAHFTGARGGTSRARYTPREDELIEQYFSGKISLGTVLSTTGRTIAGIRSRAKTLGVNQEGVSWEWLHFSENELSPRRRPGKRAGSR